MPTDNVMRRALVWHPVNTASWWRVREIDSTMVEVDCLPEEPSSVFIAQSFDEYLSTMSTVAGYRYALLQPNGALVNA